MRKTQINQQYDNAGFNPVASYSYNEVGQLTLKHLGFISTGNWLQNEDFRYNIRGWLLSINNSKLTPDGGKTNSDINNVFGMQLMYDQPDSALSNTRYYDGKPSGVKWMTRNYSNTRTQERSYLYSYNALNWYTGETYAERDSTSVGTSPYNINNDGFDEYGITMDGGGNLQTLSRNSSVVGASTHKQIDTLAYIYSSTSPNQLLRVVDGTDSVHTSHGFRNLTGSSSNYVYDGNGNLTNDYLKGLTIGYNELNRTDKITVTTGTNQYINYIYDGGGNLIEKQAYNGGTLQTTTDYVDGFVYITQGTGGTPTLSYFPMPEGRVVNVSGTLTQEFIMTDQQGNARVAFRNVGGVAKVWQENSYYGTGLILPNSPVSTPAVPNKQLYNGGSEWQNDYSNLPDYYQTYNRNYDAAIGRFISVDPLAESAVTLTSYQYGEMNPIVSNDPLGTISQAAWNEVQQIYNNGPITENVEFEDGITGYFTLDDNQNINGYVPGAGGGSGNNFDVNSNGDITKDANNPVGTDPGKQVLWATGTSTWSPSDPFIVVDQGDINFDDVQHSTGKLSYDYWSVSNNNAALSLFTFLANNTTVEWSVVLGVQDYITTSHNPIREAGGPNLVLRELSQYGPNAVSLLMHDHPQDADPNMIGWYGPSGYFALDDRHGDRNTTIAIYNAFPGNSVTYAVYEVTTSEIFFYNMFEYPAPSWYNFPTWGNNYNNSSPPLYRQFSPPPPNIPPFFTPIPLDQ